MGSRSIHILSITLLFLSTAAYGQLYHYEKFDVESGLSQVGVKALYEDDFGFLWVGTNGGGVSRFDGNNFVNFNENDGVPGELVTAIDKSATGNIIAGATWGGISEYREGRFHHYGPAYAYSGTNHILTFGGFTWLASGSGLFWLRDRTMVRLTEEELQNQVINYLAHDNKYLYAIGYNKIFVIEPVSKNLVKSLHFTLPTEAGIITINGSIVYMGTKGSGVFYCNLSQITRAANNSLITFTPLQNNRNFLANFIYTDNGGSTWVGSNDQKLYNITINRLVENKNFSFLPNGNFTSMLIDRAGTIWLGTDVLGLLKIMNPVFINYSNHDFLNDPDLFSVITDKHNNIWVGSRTRGIIVYNEGKGEIAKWNSGNGLGTDHIYALARNNQMVYAATDQGIFTFDEETGQRKGPVLMQGQHVKSMAVYNNGTVAAGTPGKGLFLIQPNGETQVYDEKQSFIHNHIHSLLLDKDQRLWVGTGNGMAFIHNGRVNIIDNANLCNTYVGCISQDRFGNIWFSTDRCLMKYDGIRFEKFDRSNGLASNTLYFVKCDHRNKVWVGSNAGVNRLVLGSYGKVEKIEHFSMNDGFIGNECNSRGVYESDKGEMYFCTIRGLIKYVGHEEFKTMCNHKVIVNNISVFYAQAPFSQIDHGPIKPGTSIYERPVFDYHQNHITFHFLCTEKCKPNDVSFSFKLENFDSKWSPPSRSNLATYSNLPPGTYTFQVKTLDKNLVPTGITDSYTFTVNAPFWMKTWFFALAAIGFFGILAFWKFRTEQKEELQRVQLEKKVNQRTIELTRQKEERELLLKEIHHRVKNNLQIINSLINLQAGQIKDPESLKVFEECKNRIKSMAIIHTRFYESKDFSKIDLADYVQHLVKDLIHTYNVNKEIELVCNINSIQMGIDTVIPVGLILNEIISNSLKYAFANAQSGIIEISLVRNLETGEFEMTVGDNGFGFDKDKFEHSDNNSLGFELIKILSEQLNGTVNLQDRPGTYYTVVFTEIDKHRSPITT